MDNDDEVVDEIVDEVDVTGNAEVVDLTLVIYLAIGAVTFLITFMGLMYLFW